MTVNLNYVYSFRIYIYSLENPNLLKFG
jgi:hypothetical protein